MLKWMGEHKLAVSFTSAFLVALLIVILSQPFQSCVNTNANAYTHQARPDESPNFIWIWWWCSGIFLNQYGAAITAVATVVMAAFTGTLWWSTVGTAEMSRKTVELAEKQFLMEGKQADLAERQHGLARLQHIAANKPRIRIRSVSIVPFEQQGRQFGEGQTVIGTLVVANIGDTDAHILESGYRFLVTDKGLPMSPPLQSDYVKLLLVPNEPLKAHESRLVEIAMDEPLGAGVNTIGSKAIGAFELYIMGFIRFEDITGRERYMGFCRIFTPPKVYDHRQGRFVPVDNPDYEYED